MNTRESKYLGGLDEYEKSLISALSSPWQRAFLTRFYDLLDTKNWTKQLVCEKVNNSSKKHVYQGYTLNKSTFTYYTSLKNPRAISVECLLALADVFEVSIDYLLGLESCETHESSNIFDATGLLPDAVKALNSNPDIQSFINHFLQAPQLKELMHQLNNLFYSEYISSDILSAYSDDLNAILTSSYNKFVAQTIPISRTKEVFLDIFVDEFKQLNIQIDNEYISKNVSDDRQLQINILAEQKKCSVPKAFVYDTVNCTYDILAYMDSKDYFRRLLINSFSEIVDDYLITKEKIMKKNLTRKFE